MQKMKKTLLLTILIFVTAQFIFAQNTIAKFKYEEAEEAYSNSNFDMALRKLTEVETLLGSTNPKISYLKINSQSKIIERNPLNDYPLLESARKLSAQYLKDYENLPDNEDKYRDIYKISERLTKYPATKQDFDLALGKAEIEKLEQKKKTEAENAVLLNALYEKSKEEIRLKNEKIRLEGESAKAAAKAERKLALTGVFAGVVIVAIIAAFTWLLITVGI